MKFLLLSALVAVALSQPLEVSDDAIEQWELFKITHDKEYKSEEEEKRKNIFFQNLQFVQEHNEKYRKGEVTFTVAINKFADMTDKEFAANMNGYKRPAGLPRKGKSFEMAEDVEVPKAVDWRKKGAVTPVKDQGSCRSCWAFSATGALEGQTFLRKKKLISLSEQNLVDCSRDEGNEGCDGGVMDSAFQYVEDNHGIDTEASYPYKGQDGECHYKPGHRGAQDTGYIDIPQGSEDALQQAVAKVGPISVAIDARLSSFQLYSGGVYSDQNCSSTVLDHGVLAVGYGTLRSGVPYWLVKNSWGTSWGMKGYIMMARNQNNTCGIATEASYPTD